MERSCFYCAVFSIYIVGMLQKGDMKSHKFCASFLWKHPFNNDLSGTVRVRQAVGEEQKFLIFLNFIWDDALASRHYFGTKSFDGKGFV